jgi:hypothetical protein
MNNIRHLVWNKTGDCVYNKIYPLLTDQIKERVWDQVYHLSFIIHTALKK